MATLEDVSEAVERLARISEDHNWIPERVTHVVKEAYSITFFRYEGSALIVDAIRSISTIQQDVNGRGWNHDPLVLIFPMGNYRLNVLIPPWSKKARRRMGRIRGIPVRAYSRADNRIVDVLEKELEGREGVISNTVQETLAAYAWSLARGPDYIARNVEITVPTPYPDPIRTKIRARRDYGITVVEMDAVGVKDDGILVMEAKAASGGRRRWENIVRRKMGTYKAVPHYLGRNVAADFVVTSNNGEIAINHAEITAREIRYERPFRDGRVIAAWARNTVQWREIE